MLSLVRVLGVGLVVACGDGGEDAEGLAGGEGGAGRGAGSGAGGAGTSASAGRGGQGDDAAGAGASSGSGRGDDAGTDAGLDAGAATDGSTSGGSAAPPVDDGSICTRDGACEQEVELAAAQHIEGDIDYGELPPAGGPHNGCWGNFGVHDEPFAPENWVHNLEHGAVVFLHDCPLGCDAELAELEGLAAGRTWAIVTAYPGLDIRFAVVAWGYRLMSDDLDLDAFAAFYDAHADQAPESVTSGKPAGCP
jgi:hypothetical protein